MKRLDALVASLVLLSAVGLPARAGLARGVESRSAGRDLLPTYHDRLQSDGPVFMAEDPAGRLWAVWSYREGGEWDIAVSRAVGRTWTAPQLLGVANGKDDLDPRLLFLDDGTGVLVWWQRGPLPEDQVVVSSFVDLRVGTTWSAPQRLSDRNEAASRPNLFVAQGTPLVGYTSTPLDPTDPGPGVALRPIHRPRPDGGAEGPEPWPDVIIRPPRSGNGGGNGSH